MKAALFGTFFGASILATTASAAQLNFSQYHTQDQINQYMSALPQAYPGLVTHATLGKSLQGREISYFVISEGDPSTKPTMYFNGTHHGDEWSATEGILGLSEYLLQHRNDADVAAILKTYAIYLQPLVNPDGHFAHTREDSQGRDPNRDYSSPDRSVGSAFEVPEIALVKKLMDQIKPRAAAAYHSGIEEVLWSWCYTADASPDAALLSNIGTRVAQAMGFDRYLQSYNDYATDGEFIDYVYQNYKTVALTFEVSDDKTPDVSELTPVVDRSVKGAMELIRAVQSHDSGNLVELVASPGSYGTHAGRTADNLE